MADSVKNDRGARIAGAILVLNASLALLGTFLRQPLGPAPRFVAIVDLVLGVSLMSGRGWTTIVIARCALGGVVLTGLEVVDGHLQVVNGDWAAAATEMLFSVGLVSLLIGRPSIPRIVVGTVASLVCVVDRVWYLFR